MDNFSEIYRDKKWGESRLYPGFGGSGKGSSVEYLAYFSPYFEQFIVTNQVHSFLDVGCGECEWQRYIDWERIDCQYIGMERVSEVVEKVQKDLQHRNDMTILQADCLSSELPKTDLALVKEVFQHWSIHDTNLFLPKLLSSSDICLTYNCDASISFFRYQTYQYFICNQLEIHAQVVNEIENHLCNIRWDTQSGGFRPCYFDSYGKRLKTFKWKWHFPAALIQIERVDEDAERGSIIYNSFNLRRIIEQITGGTYKDDDIYIP